MLEEAAFPASPGEQGRTPKRSEGSVARPQGAAARWITLLLSLSITDTLSPPAPASWVTGTRVYVTQSLFGGLK